MINPQKQALYKSTAMTAHIQQPQPQIQYRPPTIPPKQPPARLLNGSNARLSGTEIHPTNVDKFKDLAACQAEPRTARPLRPRRNRLSSRRDSHDTQREFPNNRSGRTRRPNTNLRGVEVPVPIVAQNVRQPWLARAPNPSLSNP